jgi:thymidylate synthase ThyX
MEIRIKKLTDWSVALDAARYTVRKSPLGTNPSEKFKRDICRSEHSPLRAVMFQVEMIGIPTAVSVHLVRHKYGVEHYVSSNRSDRNGGNENIGRMSPVNHMMIINAQELMFISRRRLCGQAMKETKEVWEAVVAELKKVDPIVAAHCVPMCVYRGRCHEINPCGEKQ